MDERQWHHHVRAFVAMGNRVDEGAWVLGRSATFHASSTIHYFQSFFYFVVGAVSYKKYRILPNVTLHDTQGLPSEQHDGTYSFLDGRYEPRYWEKGAVRSTHVHMSVYVLFQELIKYVRTGARVNNFHLAPCMHDFRLILYINYLLWRSISFEWLYKLPCMCLHSLTTQRHMQLYIVVN